MVAAPADPPGEAAAMSPVAAFPAAAPEAPTLAEVSGRWVRLMTHSGQEFTPTNRCNSDPQTLTVDREKVDVFWGQDGETMALTGTAPVDAGRLALTMHSEVRGEVVFTVVRVGDAWVWDGGPLRGHSPEGGAWRTSARAGAFPVRRVCCSYDPIEVYAVIEEGRACPPVP